MYEDYICERIFNYSITIIIDNALGQLQKAGTMKRRSDIYKEFIQQRTRLITNYPMTNDEPLLLVYGMALIVYTDET